MALFSPLRSTFMWFAIIAVGCAKPQERRDPFGPNTPIKPDVRFERQLQCAAVGERFSQRLDKFDPGGVLAFYCYSPTLETCVAVVDHQGDYPPSYIWDLLTDHQVAEGAKEFSSDKNMWFLNVRTSLGNECLAHNVQELAGPIGKIFADRTPKPNSPPQPAK